MSSKEKVKRVMELWRKFILEKCQGRIELLNANILWQWHDYLITHL